MLRYIITTIIITVSFSNMKGQEIKRLFDRSDRSNYIYFSGYAGVQKALDEGVTPLVYKGFAYGANMGYRSEKLSRIWEFQGYAGMGEMQSPAAFDYGDFDAYNFTFKLRYLRNVNRTKYLPLKIYAGVTLGQDLRFRSNDKMFNASFGYDYITSSGLALHIEKSLELKGFEWTFWNRKIVYKPHKITFDTDIDLPFIFLYMRPTYVVIDNFLDGSSASTDLSRMKSAFLGEVTYISANTGVSYHLLNGNVIRLGYIWRYYSITPGFSPIRNAEHLLQLIFKFKLNQSSYE